MPKVENMGKLVGQTARVMGRHLIENFRQAGHEISRGHFMVLAHLWEEDGQSQQTLMEHCGIDKTNMTRTLDTLEKRNLVVRIPDQLDRRYKRIFLTHEGKLVRKEMEQIGMQSLKGALQGIDPTELQTCQKVLRQIQANLSQHF